MCRHTWRGRNQGPAGPGCCPVYTHQGSHRFTFRYCSIAWEKLGISKLSILWWKSWTLSASAPHSSLIQIWRSWANLFKISALVQTTVILQSYAAPGRMYWAGTRIQRTHRSAWNLCHAYSITTDDAQVAEQNPCVGCNCCELWLVKCSFRFRFSLLF